MLDKGPDAGSTACINDQITAACEKLKTPAEENKTEENKDFPKQTSGYGRS